jgi:hypothetical protein
VATKAKAKTNKPAAKPATKKPVPAAKTKPATKKPVPAAKTKPATKGPVPAAKKRTPKPIAKAAEPPGGRAPNQGYEPEEEVELGNTVNPPSGVELVESVADIVGELANSGLAAGGRILKDAFSLLRRP